MDVKVVGFMIAVYSFMVDIAYAGQYKRVEVTDDVCNRTYTLNQNDQLVLSFMPHSPYDDDAQTFRHCIFTIINNSTSMPICIKSHGHTAHSYMTQHMCDMMLNYFIGHMHLPSIHTQNGYSCADFEREPKCTSTSTVYAVFENKPAFAIFPVNVEVYVKEWVVTTTRRPTTTYRYNNDDDYYDDHTNSTDFGDVMLKIIIGIGIFVTLLVICCSCTKSQQLRTLGNQPDVYSPSMPTYVPDMRSSSMPRFSADAPPYSEVMRQERLNVDKHWQTHEPVHQTQMPNAATSFPIPENQPICQDQQVPSYTSEEPAGNQITPEVPPPDYSDLPPPPPYPGY